MPGSHSVWCGEESIHVDNMVSEPVVRHIRRASALALAGTVLSVASADFGLHPDRSTFLFATFA